MLLHINGKFTMFAVKFPPQACDLRLFGFIALNTLNYLAFQSFEFDRT